MSGPRPPPGRALPQQHSKSSASPVPPPKGDGDGGVEAEKDTFFSENQLPSCLSGYFTPDEERSTRRRTCRFLEEAGLKRLKLGRLAVSTAMVFFHQFYCQHSFQDKDRFQVAVACLLLAAKTEECPKRLGPIIQECHFLRYSSIKKKDKTPPKNFDKHGRLDRECEEFIKLKDHVLLLERIILHTIGFELDINHPYKHIHNKIAKLMKPSKQLEYINPPAPGSGANLMAELVQKAINFANDSMHTSLCLQFRPESVAHACVYLSGQFVKVRPTEGRPWLDILDIDMVDLTSISLQIMDLIADRKGLDKEGFESIEGDLKKMKSLLEHPTQQNRQPLPHMNGRDAKRQRL